MTPLELVPNPQIDDPVVQALVGSTATTTPITASSTTDTPTDVTSPKEKEATRFKRPQHSSPSNTAPPPAEQEDSAQAAEESVEQSSIGECVVCVCVSEAVPC